MDTQEAVGETMGMASSDQVPISKGRRTKRHRPSSPFSLASSSSSDGRGHGSSSSPMNSISFGTEEEEDMANCLILLARGNHKNGRASTEAIPTATTGTGEDGLYVYECKTCNRCFPSFQALGGHRASHKKPKAMMMVNDQEKKAALVEYGGDVGQQFNTSSPAAILPKNKVSSMFNSHNNKPSKVHECSICGSEFTSGQALGGHMRRHRTPTTATTLMAITHNIAPVQESNSNRGRNLLALDLNLPAPEEDVCESKFSFSSRQQQPQQEQQSLIFSASPLVDCHY